MSHYEHTTHILLHMPEFLSRETIFLFSYVQVTWCHVERPIRALNESRRSSLKSRGVAHSC